MTESNYYLLTLNADGKSGDVSYSPQNISGALQQQKNRSWVRTARESIIQ